MPSLYYWRATYSDGSQVTSDETAYDQIDRSRLKRFEIVERSTQHVMITVPIEPSDCLIWRKRSKLNSGRTSQHFQLVCRERGVGRFHIQVLTESDRSIHVHHHFSQADALLAEPERLPFEV